MDESQRLQLSASEHAKPAGSEAIASDRSSQQPPSPKTDSAVSHLRNALQVIESLWHAMLRDPETRYGFDAQTVDRLTVPLDDVAHRITAAVELLEADAKRARYLLPYAATDLRKKIVALSALGVNPQTGQEIVQLSIVTPPLAPGGHEYLVQLQQAGKALLAAIVEDRVDILDEEAAQIRRVQAILEGASDVDAGELREQHREMMRTNHELATTRAGEES